MWLWTAAPIHTSCVTWDNYLTFLSFSFFIEKTGMMTTVRKATSITRWLTWCNTKWTVVLCLNIEQDFFFHFNLNLKFFQCYILQIESTEMTYNFGSWLWVYWHFQMLHILSSQLPYLCYLRIVFKIKWEFK